MELLPVDQQILAQLRRNARTPLTKLAEKLGVPVSTIYDKMKMYEKSIITKHASLLDLPKLGFQARTYLALRVGSGGIRRDITEDVRGVRKQLQEFLLASKNVNSLYRVHSEYDLLAECIFKNMLEAQDFVEQLRVTFAVDAIQRFAVIAELKKEEFLPWT